MHCLPGRQSSPLMAAINVAAVMGLICVLRDAPFGQLLLILACELNQYAVRTEPGREQTIPNRG
jgi:hypothetical protein